MKYFRWLAWALGLTLLACQPSIPSTIIIIDGGKIIPLQTEERIPTNFLSLANISITSKDQVFSRGSSIPLDQPLDKQSNTIEIRRAVTVNAITPNGQQTLQTTSFTVGEALAEAGYQVLVSDVVTPPLTAPIMDNMTITVTAAKTITVIADGNTIQTHSSAQTVGKALAEAGIPLIGFDYSLPFENEALPPDGQIKVVRVNESITLIQKPIPFETEFVQAANVPLDQTQILSPGENGLSVQRVRVRYEDGQEVSRLTEDETIVKTPKTQTTGYGIQVEIKSAAVDGVQIEYWRAVQMYATSYSPCNLGTTYCGSTTASGQTLQKGVVALRTDLYYGLRGQRVYIPGYGFATVEDACGGCVGKPWIDLGYSDSNYEPWHSWVTVYFLTPVPQTILYTLE